MADKRAQDIIREQQREEAKAGNFKILCQQVADLMLPHQDEITTEKTPGEDKSRNLFDPTAMLDLQDMVSGLSAAFFPTGQQAFGLTVKNKNLGSIDRVRRYLALASQIAHEELYDSNFMLQLNEALSQEVAFGIGNLYSEWDNDRLGLNFKAWEIGRYTIKQNSQGIVDTMILRFPYTAYQAVSEFGESAGPDVLKAAGELDSESNRFDFIHIVRRRNKRNVLLSDNLNMPFESVFVNVKEELVVDEGGFDEFPFAVPRWMKSAGEKYGRGQGTLALSIVREVQQMHKDLVECGNKWNNPPREVLDTFEGAVKVTPGACNFVRERGTIRALEQNVLGNFPITREILEFIQAIIHRAFFADVFAPLANLTGDRRTTLEIIERVKQAMKKLALPVYRTQNELFVPCLTRPVLLLIRNGRIPPPPPELRGQQFGIEFMGELALAMRDQQARAFQQFAGLVGQLEAVFPGSRDVINMDAALPDVALTFGMKVEHLATEEEIAAKRQARAALEMQQKLALAAQVASQAYGKTTKAPEAGSPAGELMGALK